MGGYINRARTRIRCDNSRDDHSLLAAILTVVVVVSIPIKRVVFNSCIACN